MSSLRLPKEWGSFSFHKKQFYLVDTHQAKNISEASVLLARRTKRFMRSEFKKVLAQCQPEVVRLPYKD